MLSDSTEPRRGTIDQTGSEQPPVQLLIESACHALGIGVFDLRLACWAFGARLTRADLVAFLEGTASLPDHEYDRLAAALNDRLVAADLDQRIPYSEDLK